MARPTKKGLDYFPLDVDFLSDLKVRRIIKACGKEAVHILLALLANVYRDEGYYVLWDEDLAFLVADEVGAKEGTVEELVKKAVQVKFFDKEIFDKYSVLTSKGIQNRYILATKERKKVELEFKYLLTNEVNRSNISINGRNNSINQENNQQSKVKESKAKEIKESSSTATSVDAFQSFQMLWQFPNEFQRLDLSDLIEKHSNELVDAAIKVAGTKDVPKNRAINFLTASLQEWADANVKTIDQAREYQRMRMAKNQKYNKPVREEKLPDWAVNEQEEAQLSPERQAELDAKLAAYLNKTKH